MNEARAPAERALAEVGVRPDRLRAVAGSFNTVVRADAGERSYAVRVGPRTRIHPEGSEETEAGWLETIRRDGASRVDRVATEVRAFLAAGGQDPG